MSSAGSTGGGGRQQMPSGPPYPPAVAQIGGTPTVAIDVPISAVLLFLFLCGAATHMTIFQINRRRDHKFLFSALLFGFCMARTTALVMRIVWATRPTNVNVAIAAGILTQAGVLLLFVVNLVFSQRILRAYHPHLGWHRAVKVAFATLYALVGGMLVMVIVTTVQSFFTLDPATRQADRTVQLVASTFLAALAFLPVPIVAAAAWSPRATRVEKFGQGRFRSKIRLLVGTALLLSLGAGFRTGAAFDARPLTNPAWYHSRACYYCFNYVIELVVVFVYAVSRFDRRFHVPDGSRGPGHYAGGLQKPTFADRVNREGDVFGDGGVDDGTDVAGRPSTKADETRWEQEARMELTSADPARLRDGVAV